MGRPWEYSRWRRALMQMTMWLIFGCTLGLAQLISIRRTHIAQALDGVARIDGFLVRLPEDWTFTRIEDSQVQGVQGFDPDTHRIMRVLVLQLQDLQELAPPKSRTPFPAARKIEFTGLHRTGTLRMENQLYQMPQGAKVMKRTLTAAVALPPRDAIIVQLIIGPETQLGRADTRLMHDVAADITPAPATDHSQDDPGS